MANENWQERMIEKHNQEVQDMIRSCTGMEVKAVNGEVLLDGFRFTSIGTQLRVEAPNGVDMIVSKPADLGWLVLQYRRDYNQVDDSKVGGE